MTLTFVRINTYEKHKGVLLLTNSLFVTQLFYFQAIPRSFAKKNKFQRGEEFVKIGVKTANYGH